MKAFSVIFGCVIFSTVLLFYQPPTGHAQPHRQLSAAPGLADADLAGSIVTGSDPAVRLLALDIRFDGFTAADLDRLHQAIIFAGEDNWPAARSAVTSSTEPLFVSFIAWLEYRSDDGDARFSDIQNFLMSHAGWPEENRLRRNAEAAIGLDFPDTDRDEIADYFRRFPPLTATGLIANFENRAASPDLIPAPGEIQTAWIETDFSADDEASFLSQYESSLDQQTHIDRLDRLTWDRRGTAARRMYALVTPSDVALTKARLTLAGGYAGADQAIAAVPETLRENSALLYERLRWRRRNDLDDAAMEILANSPDMLAHPNKWARERRILSRRAYSEGNFEDAYTIAGGHGLDRGASFAELEFLAGWIAMTGLDRSATALTHFTSLYHNTTMPISRARGAFWAGRAAAMGGDTILANWWYGLAAGYPAVFYGQQALLELGRPLPLVATTPEPNRADAMAFDADEMNRLAGALHILGNPGYAAIFARAAGRNAVSPQQRVLAARKAITLGMPHIAVYIGKRSVRATGDVIASGYPVLAPPASSSNAHAPELALILSIIRQESSFRTDAVSPAGARGLMQLMPSTANEISTRSGIAYNRALLTSDGDYNMRLGISLLGDLLEKYDGSYALAAAAYNAGGHRVDIWLDRFGDPRPGQAGSSIDLIDWIESIPFSETRNYVQRVLEAVLVYRQILTASAAGNANTVYEEKQPMTSIR